MILIVTTRGNLHKLKIVQQLSFQGHNKDPTYILAYCIHCPFSKESIRNLPYNLQSTAAQTFLRSTLARHANEHCIQSILKCPLPEQCLAVGVSRSRLSHFALKFIVQYYSVRPVNSLMSLKSKLIRLISFNLHTHRRLLLVFLIYRISISNGLCL